MRKILLFALLFCAIPCKAQVNPNVGINPNAVILTGMSNPSFNATLNPCSANWIFDDWVHGIYYGCGTTNANAGTWFSLGSTTIAEGNNTVSISYPTANGSISLTNASYFVATGGDFVFGTYSNTNLIHVEVGANSLDSVTIGSTGMTINVPITAQGLPITQNPLVLTTLSGINQNTYLGNLLPKCNPVRNYQCVM